jgi:hypothetical protein
VDLRIKLWVVAERTLFALRYLCRHERKHAQFWTVEALRWRIQIQFTTWTFFHIIKFCLDNAGEMKA